MRPLAPTAQQSGRGRGALHAMLLAGGAVLALTWAALALADPTSLGAERLRPSRAGVHLVQGEAASCEPTEQRPVCLHPRALASEEWGAAVGASSGLRLPQQGFSARGRAGFSLDSHAVHRAVRERLEALVIARARVMRAPTLPVAVGSPADRPPLVTRPPRGPPA